MDKFCEDCIHNEVCQYGAIPPHTGRCNDKDTLDDLIPRGEWIENNYGRIQCSICKRYAISTMTGCLMDRHLEQYKTKFCPWCGAKLKGGSNGQFDYSLNDFRYVFCVFNVYFELYQMKGGAE